MKIDKRIQTSRSIYLLEQKIRKYFNERDINPVIFCNNCDVLWPDDDIIDAVWIALDKAFPCKKSSIDGTVIKKRKKILDWLTL